MVGVVIRNRLSRVARLGRVSCFSGGRLFSVRRAARSRRCLIPSCWRMGYYSPSRYRGSDISLPSRPLFVAPPCRWQWIFAVSLVLVIAGAFLVRLHLFPLLFPNRRNFWRGGLAADGSFRVIIAFFREHLDKFPLLLFGHPASRVRLDRWPYGAVVSD